MMRPVVEAGRTCWKVGRADRLAFLIDGAAYFEAFYHAALGAERSILILSWDLDTRTRLLRGAADHDFPNELGDFLRALLRRKRRLNVHILNWDFAMIYALERQWMPMLPVPWLPHRRLKFELNDRTPIGGCQHEKLIVIDDAIAFVGGLDLTKTRWDTPSHQVDDPLRVDPDGTPYAPFHDVHAMVAGEIASGLGDLVRERWRAVTGRTIAPPARRLTTDLWPPSVLPDLSDVPVGIARTRPSAEGHPEAREIERLYIEAIRAARRSVFLETQYFTSGAVGEALEARLCADGSPEVILVTRQNSDGWLEQHTMDVLRARLVRRLRQCRHAARFRVYCPTVPGLRNGECIGVHSKVLIVDDRLVSIGSANVSNRSMGLDTECNLVVEACGDTRVRDAIARLRHRLLGEHLDVDPVRVKEAEQRGRSIIAAIERLREGERQLCECACEVAAEIDELIPDAAVIDPERPVDAAQLWAMVARAPEHRRAGRRILAAISVLILLCLLAAAWRWGPLHDRLDVPALLETAQSWRRWPDGVLLLLGGYVIGGLLAMPVTLLIAVTVAALGPWLGFAAALGGSLVSAMTTFGIGRWLGRTLVRRLAGPSVNELDRRLAASGLLSILMVRIAPIAPFTVVNLAAGASRIGLEPFLWGTLLGMSPGILVAALFVDRLTAAIVSPNSTTVTLLVVAGLGGWMVVASLVRRLQSVRHPEERRDGQRVMPAGG